MLSNSSDSGSPTSDKSVSDGVLSSPDVPKRKGGMVGSVFNLTNTVIGSGVLALPYAYRISGFILGNLFLIIISGFGCTSVYMIVQAEKRLSRRMGGAPQSYVTLAVDALGKKGGWISDAAMCALTFGGLTSYLVIIADLMQPFLAYVLWKKTSDDDDGQEVSRVTITLLALLILVPVSSLKNMDALKFTSTLALIAIVFMVVLIIYKSIDSLADGSFTDCGQHGCVSYAHVSADFFRTIPIICFAFTCHMNILPIYNELKAPTDSRYLKIGYFAHLICVVAYALVGTFGYLTFYDDTKSNVIKNYDPDDISMVIGRAAIAMTVAFTFPMLAYPLLKVLERVLFPNRPWNTIRHVALMLAVAGLCVLVALLVDDISVIFGLTGAFASTTISFILPSMFYLRIAEGPPEHHDSEVLLASSDLVNSSELDDQVSYQTDPGRRTSLNGHVVSEDDDLQYSYGPQTTKLPGSRRMRVVAWILFMLGFVFMIASASVTISEAVNGSDDDSSDAPPPTPAPTPSPTGAW